MYTVVSAPSSRTSLGATLAQDKASAVFRVWAPYASGVDVFLQPNSATAQVSLGLKPDDARTGYWSAEVAGARTHTTAIGKAVMLWRHVVTGRLFSS